MKYIAAIQLAPHDKKSDVAALHERMLLLFEAVQHDDGREQSCHVERHAIVVFVVYDMNVFGGFAASAICGHSHLLCCTSTPQGMYYFCKDGIEFGCPSEIIYF